jgi:hypothetical protein
MDLADEKQNLTNFSIDWRNYWCFMQNITLFEMALLSLGYNPEFADLNSTESNFFQINWHGKYLYYLDWIEDPNGIKTRDININKRISLIFDNARIGQYFDKEAFELYGKITIYQKFNLPLFSKWANDNNLTIPDELKKLSQKNNNTQTRSKPSNEILNNDFTKSKQSAQENTLLNILRSAGHDPLKLPPRPSGTKWIKSEIKKIALTKHPKVFTNSSFDKTWERLRQFNLIKEVSPSK